MSVVSIVTGDKKQPPDHPRHPIVFVLDRLRSAFNVGNIFRLAEICHIQEVVTCGYTATPPHDKLEKTARGCDKLVPYRHFPDTVQAVHRLKQEGFTVMAVETVADAPTLWDASYTFPLALVLGNEALGVQQDVLDLCDGFIKLPVYGTKNSLNVGNAASAVVYQALRELV